MSPKRRSLWLVAALAGIVATVATIETGVAPFALSSRLRPVPLPRAP
jgi:hypothetical protein